MSNADPEEVSAVIERDGVSVEKSFEPDDFPVPAIAFVIRSDRDVPVEVTLVDSVPDEIEAEDIGFHPKYGADFWDNDEGRLVFKREFEPGEEYTTVYGLRARDTESVERFLGEPEIERVDPPREAGDEDVGKVVSDVMNEGGSAGVAGSTGPAEASDDDLEAAIAAADVSDDVDAAIRSVEAGEAGADSTTSADTDDATGSGPSADAAGVSLSAEAVASALAAEIRSGAVDDADLEALRDGLGVERSDGSVGARISHLQTEVSDLQAYTTALEEFLDENGDAQSLLRDLRTTIDGVEGELDTIRTDVDQVSSSVADATAEVDEMSETVSELRSSVQSIDDRLGNVQSDVTEVRSDVESVRSEVGSLRDDVGRVERDVDDVREEVEGDVADVRESVERDVGDVRESVERDVADVREEIGEVREEMPDAELEGLDGRVDDIDDRIAELEAELEQLAQMRERMASVFGGAPASDDGGDGDEDEDDSE